MATVGSVPYVNALPLIGAFLREDLGVKVVTDVPSRLPALLDSGDVAAILVSSIEALRRPGARVAGGVGIISRGRVESVRLLSRVPFGEIRTLALDQSSMTSNLLAQIVLAETWAVRPAVQPEPPDLDVMLSRHDACVLIGDIGMQADGSGLHDLDLGEAWTDLTGLPFVWAMWLGHEGLTPGLTADLAGALEASGLGADRAGAWDEDFLAWAVAESGWDPRVARRYLLETMHFRLDEPALAGLREFASRASALGLAGALSAPEVVGSRVYKTAEASR